MELKEKLTLLSLSDGEMQKAEQKFLATLALVSAEELKDIIDYLSTQGVQITKAKEIKVVGNSRDEIAKKFNILGEIHATDIYKQDPTIINLNVIDVYKKIKYCIQIGKSYKREDGTYEPFLFSEIAWQKEINRGNDNIKIEPVVDSSLEDIITVEPEITPVVEPVADNTHIDIKDYMAANNDIASIEAKTTNFANLRQELEGQLANLADYKSSLADEIAGELSFADIEPESYGMGRAA